VEHVSASKNILPAKGELAFEKYKKNYLEKIGRKAEVSKNRKWDKSF
jgi:hypothetical protein